MIIEYVIKNKKDIEKDMNNSLKISKNSHKNRMKEKKDRSYHYLRHAD